MANLAAVLAAGGLTFADVVKTTIFLADMSDFATVNAVYGESFQSGTTPARSTVAVAALARVARASRSTPSRCAAEKPTRRYRGAHRDTAAPARARKT